MAVTQIRGAQILNATVTEADLASSVAGNGLSGGAGTALALDLFELTDVTIDVTADSVAIVDATDNSTKRETVVGLVAGIAGSGLSAASGQLSISAGSITVDRLSSFRPSNGGGLNLAVAAGKIRQDNAVASYAGGTVVLADDDISYVEVDSAGSVTSNLVGYTTGRWPIATVTTASGAITVIVDDRTWADIELGTTSLTNSNFVDNETPSGDLDGVDVTYTLANAPSPAGSLHVYLNGIRQKSGAGNDYTFAGSTITFAVAPVATDVILADYRK